MTDYLLDTDIAIEVIRRRAARPLQDWLRTRSGSTWISAITLVELRYGADRSARQADEHEEVDRFVTVSPALEFSTRAAGHAADIRTSLRRAGTPIGPYDVLIAGHARSLGAILLTGNIAEFSRVPGLLVEDWRAIA